MQLLLPLFGLLPLISAVPVIEKRTGPTPRLVQYVQTFTNEAGNPLSLLPLLNKKTQVTNVILASLHLNSAPGDIHLNDDPPNATMFDQTWQEVKTLQASGIKVGALLGGAAQGSYQLLSGDEASFQSYYQPLLNNVIKAYNLDGLDLDIEETVNVSVPLRLINQLYSDLGPNFEITMAPVASAMASPDGADLSGFSYFDLDKKATAPSNSSQKLVTWYNTQFYSGFGDPSTPATYETIIAAGWAPSRIVMGVLDSNDDGSGWVPIGLLNSTIKSLRAQYGTSFGGVDGWEYFNAGNSDGFAQPYEWTRAIGADLFGPLLKRTNPTASIGGVGIENLPTPPSPFDSLVVEDLRTRMGVGHFEAVRALNLTKGDRIAARGLLMGMNEKRSLDSWKESHAEDF
ncbi:MAG: hypothetical protein MMC33_008028 [Icmadophila ericetorum]|nr:hypothetical protein [Icmadophila ericetorum]